MTLTAFLKLCAEDVLSKTLTYDKIPNYYTWNQAGKKFSRRKQETAVYTIHLNNIEYFHLRMLLHIMKSPTSFWSLCTVQSVTNDTFQGACKAFGLLDDVSYWENTLSEASTHKSLWYLFAIMLKFCQKILWCFSKIIAKIRLMIYCIGNDRNCHQMM